METYTFGGNSGSPVFFHFNQQRNPNDTGYLLAGVMKGYFQNWAEAMVIETKVTAISPQNVGIAAVIPAHYLYEILYSEELKKNRAEHDKPFLPAHTGR